MGGEVLCLINDHIFFHQAAAPDISKRFNHKLSIIYHPLQSPGHFTFIGKLAPNDTEVVKQRLHIRPYL